MPPISYTDIEKLSRKLDLANEALSYDIRPPITAPSPTPSPTINDTPFPTPSPTIGETPSPTPSPTPPPSVSPIVDFEPYAKIAEQAYKKERVDTTNHNYLEEFSTPDYAVYQNNLEYVIGVRGSSPSEPLRDFVRDAQVALGSVSTLTGLNPLGPAINEVSELVNKLKKRDDGKKFHVTGHSLGGSIASYFGVDNPDVDITTFNKGEGLPFLTDSIKCSISGCRNIKNYRISGDFASLGSKLGNIGEYQNLRPVRPTEKVKEEARLAGGFFIEPELYLPHSLSNFIGRKNKVEMNSNIYARPLAGKIGRVAGAVLPIIGGAVYQKIERNNLMADRLAAYENVAMNAAEESRDFGFAEVAADYDQLIADKTASFKNILNFGGNSFLGRSAGEFAGLAFYEAFLSTDQ